MVVTQKVRKKKLICQCKVRKSKHVNGMLHFWNKKIENVVVLYRFISILLLARHAKNVLNTLHILHIHLLYIIQWLGRD